MTVADEQIPLRDELDDKVTRVFAGKVVRKDLVRKVKVGANVPGLRPRVPPREVLRLVRRDGDPDGDGGRQQDARGQLHPSGRVDEGAEQGQGEGHATRSSTR